VTTIIVMSTSLAHLTVARYTEPREPGTWNCVSIFSVKERKLIRYVF